MDEALFQIKKKVLERGAVQKTRGWEGNSLLPNSKEMLGQFFFSPNSKEMIFFVGQRKYYYTTVCDIWNPY